MTSKVELAPAKQPLKHQPPSIRPYGRLDACVDACKIEKPLKTLALDACTDVWTFEFGTPGGEKFRRLGQTSVTLVVQDTGLSYLLSPNSLPAPPGHASEG